jgi:hypothetical protein
MNSIMGAAVYGGGEVIAQYPLGLDNIDWPKVSQIGALGSLGTVNSDFGFIPHFSPLWFSSHTFNIVAENGILMSLWYSTLTRFVGSSVSTRVVALKCLLDQVFFATQQDGLFLALVALNQNGSQFEAALKEVQETFLTTWINDCSVWPLVNFVGFAWIPPLLQPSYMAVIQLLWQVNISAAANAAGPVHAEDLEHSLDVLKSLDETFKEIDVDNVSAI